MLQPGFTTSAAQESVCDISFLNPDSSQNSLGCASPVSVQRKTDPRDPRQDQSPGTPYTWHHCHQRRTRSQEIILFFSRALWAAWLVATSLKERHLFVLCRWRLAVLRPTAWPKAVPEPLHKPDGCWKLEFILDAEYSHGLRADFSPCVHICSTVRAVSLKESIPDHLTSPSTVSSGDKKPHF